MTVRSESLLHYLRQLTAPSDNDAGDAVLLKRFASQGDESAFSALLARHGPMVLSVCRRILRDGHAAEDAFQATFLVLARKAGALRRPKALASWLYGTAHHLASTARRAEARRHEREDRCQEYRISSSPRDLLDDFSARELLLALDEELARMPESYRLPLILCHLEGHTYEEAARLLGWTVGSVKGRLERGRKQLHARLTRRGLALGAGLLALECMAPTTVSGALRLATMQSARTFAAGSAEGIAASVLALAETGVASVTMTKAKVVLILLLALGLVGGTGLFAFPLRSGEHAEEEYAEAATTPESRTETPKPVSDKHALTDTYGDPLPPGAIARMGTIRFRHDGDALSVAYSPDGKMIASGERNDGPVILWDAATGKELRRLDEEPGVRGRFAFSPDGKQLAWAKWGSWVGIWDVATGKQVRRLKAESGGAGGCVAYSADGKTLATSPGQAVVLFDARTGTERRRLEGHPDQMIASIAFSPDGKILAAGGWNKTIVLWDTTTAKILHRLAEHEQQVPGLAFSADGKTLASASHDRTARLWDVETGREQRRFVHQHKYNDDAIQTVHFVPGHPWLITGGSRFIRVWDLPTGKEVRHFPGHFCQCDCPVSLSPDGTKVATREHPGQIVLWELATGKRLFTPGGHQGFIVSVAFSPDGRTLATGSGDKTLRLWDAVSGKEMHRSTLTYNTRIAFVPDGKLLAAGSDGLIRIWDAATFKELHRFPTHKDGLGHVVFAADGKTCITSGVNRQSFAADGKTLIESTSDKLIRRWRVETGEEIGQFEGLSKAAGVLALSPDGSRLVSVNDDKPVRLWGVASGKEIRQFRGHKGWLACVAFSPDGKTIAAGGRGKVIHLWDAATGEEVRQLTGHEDFTGGGENSIHAVRFSPDGRTLASAAYDRTIRLWEVATWQERHRFHGHRQPVWTLDFSRDGRRLASAGMDATVLVWDVMGRITAEREGVVRLPENELNRLWTELADEKNAALAYQAIRALLRDPTATMRLFQENVRPVPAIDRARIDPLIADLDSAEFAVREKAVHELERQGEAVEGALRKVLEGRPSLEMRQRVKLLLEKLTGANRLRKLRAVEVLEHLDTAESRGLLETLAGGASEARLTQEAKASVRRMTPIR